VAVAGVAPQRLQDLDELLPAGGAEPGGHPDVVEHAGPVDQSEQQ